VFYHVKSLFARIKFLKQQFSHSFEAGIMACNKLRFYCAKAFAINSGGRAFEAQTEYITSMINSNSCLALGFEYSKRLKNLSNKLPFTY